MKDGMSIMHDSVRRAQAGDFGGLRADLAKALVVADSVALSDPVVYLTDYARIDKLPRSVRRAVPGLLEFLRWALQSANSGEICFVPPSELSGVYEDPSTPLGRYCD